MTSILGLLTLLLLSYTAHCQTCSDFDAEVLILGGGMAGVSAANRLTELGITDFIILESQDRLGGRMRTAELVPGVTVDVGANWIHGVDPTNPRLHPLYNLAARCSQNGEVEGFYSDYDNITTYYSNGTEVDDDNLRYDPYYDAFEAAIEEFRNAPSANRDTSVRTGLARNGWTPSSPEDNFVEWFEFDFCFAVSPDDIALLSAAEDNTLSDFLDESEEPEDFLITNSRGFPHLIQCLANNFSTNPATDERIRLNTMVTQIEYGDECVCVTATQDGEDRTYCAPYAIVTFSVGVLKAGASSLFSPALSAAKVNALNFVVMSFYHIIYAQYDERFWNNNEFIGHIHTNRSYFPIIQVFPSQDVNAVLFHVAEDEAQRLTSLPEEEIKSEITALFRGIYGGSVPEPTRVLSFPWATDPSFLGSYSDIRTGGVIEMVENLNEPAGRLYFAGEGTSREYYSYAHGAYLSGIETADEVMQQRASSGSKLSVNIVALVLISLGTVVAIKSQ